MSRQTFIAATALSLLLVWDSSPAQEKKKQDPCENAQTTVEMRDCAGKEYMEADAELNSVYRQLASKLETEGHRAALKAAQLAWIKYRDANCEFESYLNRGGTIYPVVYESCRARMTVDRTRELREMLKQD